MPSKRATFGVDLHLELPSRGVRAGLETALRDAVQTGRLPAGARLPSSRVLALDLGLARNTVADAYDQLIAEGWLTARRGSGTRVADRIATHPAPPRPVEPEGRFRYDLRAGYPDLSFFPRAAWLAASRQAINTASFEAFGYCDPRGRPELRNALAEYLSRARGVRVSADQLVVCAGFDQALQLLCEWLHSNGGTTIAFEAFGFASHRAVATASGLHVHDLTVDAQGAEVAALGESDAVLLTPAHQFPIGSALSPQRRSSTVEWAVRRNRLVIEDDYDGEFRYDRQPVGAMQALAPDHVVYIGTASKALAPGLRLAWMALPTRLVADIVAAKQRTARLSSSLDQLTLAEFIASNAYDRHVRRSRLTYRRRRDRMVAALENGAASVRVTGIAAGMHAVVELTGGEREDEVVRRAAEAGLAIQGLGSYTHGPAINRQAVVVGYGTPPEHAFGAALGRLVDVLT
jgi:GntR family transcriptional regulator / MocR family aminotransferase